MALARRSVAFFHSPKIFAVLAGTEQAQRQVSDTIQQHHATSKKPTPTIIPQLLTPEFKSSLSRENWELATSLYTQKMDELAKAGANIVVIPYSAAHHPILAQTPTAVPVISMPGAAAEACKKADFKRTAIIGDQTVASYHLYLSQLATLGIKGIFPSEANQLIINAAIREFKEKGVLNQETLKALERAVEHTCLDGCDSVLITCDSTLLAGRMHNLPPVVDATDSLTLKSLQVVSGSRPSPTPKQHDSTIDFSTSRPGM